MKTIKIVVLTSVCFVAVAVAVASAQKAPVAKPEKPDKIETIVQALAARVDGVEAAVAGLLDAVTDLQTHQVTRTVFSGFIDLDGSGDVVRDEVGSDNIRRVRHFAAFPIAGLLADDPPIIHLYQRRRAEGTPPFPTATGFVLSNAIGLPGNTLGGFSVFTDPTLIVVEDGQILVQFRWELYSPPAAPTPNIVRHGLDGPGGAGEYRLVVVR